MHMQTADPPGRRALSALGCWVVQPREPLQGAELEDTAFSPGYKVLL